MDTKYSVVDPFFNDAKALRKHERYLNLHYLDFDHFAFQLGLVFGPLSTLGLIFCIFAGNLPASLVAALFALAGWAWFSLSFKIDQAGERIAPNHLDLGSTAAVKRLKPLSQGLCAIPREERVSYQELWHEAVAMAKFEADHGSKPELDERFNRIRGVVEEAVATFEKLEAEREGEKVQGFLEQLHGSPELALAEHRVGVLKELSGIEPEPEKVMTPWERRRALTGY